MYPKSMSKSSRYSSADTTSTDTPHSQADPTVNPSAGLSASKIKGNKRLYYPYPRTLISLAPVRGKLALGKYTVPAFYVSV